MSAGGYYYQKSNEWIDAYLNKLPDSYHFELGRKLYGIQALIADQPKATDGQKFLIFKDQAKSFLDSYFHVSTASLSTDVVNYTTAKIGGLLNTYNTEVLGTTGESLGAVKDLGDAALEHVGQSAKAVADLTEESNKKISGVYTQVTDQNKTMFDSITEYIANLFGATTTRIEVSHDNLTDTLNEVTEANLGHLTSYYEYTGEQAKKTAERSLESIVNLETVAKQTLDTTATDTLDGIVEYSEAVKTQSEKTYDLFGELFKAFTEQAITPVSELASSKSSNLGFPKTESNVGAANQARSIFSLMFKQLSAAVGGGEDFSTIIDAAGEHDSIVATLLATVVYTIANAMLVVSASGVSNTARLQDLQQRVMSNDPVSDFSAQEAAALKARGYISEDEARAAGLKQGMLYDKTDTLSEAAKQPLSMSEAISAFRRGFIDAPRLNRNAERLGYDLEDAETVTRLSDILPGPNDLIQMAVREVFSPDIAEKFQLFSDIPPAFIEYAEQQGLSEEWSKRYWGAHWQLPSAQQGFEMFHRGLIDEETLNLLIRALDVSPIWREPLKGITYNQITRVDIRRIFQLGLIDRDEVFDRFRKNGYSPEDSELLTQFYEVYTGDQEDKSALDPKGVTMSQVRDLRKLGTISFDQAVEQLEIVGYDQDYAVILVQSWIDEAEYKARADLINRYTRRAIREDMNDSEVESLFAELNLTHDELVNVKRVVSVERLEFSSIPSKAELFTLASKGIIDYDKWYHMMRRHGYSDEIIEWYRQWKFGG